MAKEKESLKSDCFKKIIEFAKSIESKGIKANGDEVVIPAPKDGLVGCGDLSFQQMMSSLGDIFKSMRYFCTYCECEGGDHDLLGYVTGHEVCGMCKRNGRTKCAHRNVNNEDELMSKGHCLLKELVNIYKRRSCNESATLRDMLPLEPVDYFAGYHEDFEKVMERKYLREEMSDDQTVLYMPHIYDYARHSIHTEETAEVFQKSRLKYDPNAVDKANSTKNIEYITGDNTTRGDLFVKNVTKDLWLRGYKEQDLPQHSQDKGVMLQKCIHTGIAVSKYRNALKIN